MGFTKLDEGILQSSVMAAPPVTFKVWIALLAACRSNGVAPVSPTYLASVCRLSPKEIGRALEELASPDPNSRTTTDEGRRITRVDGGFRLINYQKYRDLGLREAESVARVERRRRSRKVAVRTGSGLVPDPSASASASASASETEGGGGGGAPVEAFYRAPRPTPPTNPAEQAEQATRSAINSAQLRLGAMLCELAEHPKSIRSVPDWCRVVTAYDDARSGDRRNGVADFRTIFSLDRLERSIEDAKWHLAKLNGKEPARGAR